MTVTIGRVGVWAPYRLLAGAEGSDAVAELDELGFGALWVGNGEGMFDLTSVLLDATRAITVATGVLNIRRNPVSAATAAARYAALTARHPGRFLLGLGNGWSPTAGQINGLTPFANMVRYLDELDAAIPPVPADGRVLAALGPRMFALAAERGLGAHPFLTTPEHTRWARELLGDGPVLVPEQKIMLETDHDTARRVARQELDFYLTKPNYTFSLRRLGFTEEDFAAGGSDRLVDALVAWGDVDTVLKRIDEHHQAGADHVAIQAITEDTAFSAGEARWRFPSECYRELATALPLTA